MSAYRCCNDTNELLKTVNEFTQRREYVRQCWAGRAVFVDGFGELGDVHGCTFMVTSRPGCGIKRHA